LGLLLCLRAALESLDPAPPAVDEDMAKILFNKKTKPFPKTRIPRWELRPEMKKSTIEDWNLREKKKRGQYNRIVDERDRLPVGQVVRKIDFYRRRKKRGGYVWRGRPVTLSLSPSLSLQRKNRERREREQRPVKEIQIYI